MSDGPLRVGLVCPYSLSVPGGVQAQVLGLARALRDRGHEVRVVAPGSVPAAVGTSVGRAVPVPVNGSMAPMVPSPTAVARAVRTVRGGRFDVVHLHEPLAPSITIPVVLARPAPLVGTFHAAGDRTPYRWCGRPAGRLAGRLDARVAVSPAAAQLVERYLGGGVEVVGNGIELERFRSGPVGRAVRPTVLFLGRHEERKGVGVLVEAAASLPGGVDVWIAGEGPLMADLRRRAVGCADVRWLGTLPECEKIERLRAAWVVCAPSLGGESFGVVLLEAMAAGAVVVASDLPAYRAVAGPAAWYVPPGDAVALAGALRRVLGDGALRDRLAWAGAGRVEQYSMADVARRYEVIYRRTIASAPPAGFEPATHGLGNRCSLP